MNTLIATLMRSFRRMEVSGLTLRNGRRFGLKVGFRVRGHARIVNSAVFNNYEVFKMDDPLAIDHVDGNLTVANCHFVKTSPHARLYRGASKYPLRWRDNTLVRFADKERRIVDEKLTRDAQTSKEGRR